MSPAAAVFDMQDEETVSIWNQFITGEVWGTEEEVDQLLRSTVLVDAASLMPRMAPPGTPGTPFLTFVCPTPASRKRGKISASALRDTQAQWTSEHQTNGWNATPQSQRGGTPQQWAPQQWTPPSPYNQRQQYWIPPPPQQQWTPPSPYDQRQQHWTPPPPQGQWPGQQQPQPWSKQQRPPPTKQQSQSEPGQRGTNTPKPTTVRQVFGLSTQIDIGKSLTLSAAVASLAPTGYEGKLHQRDLQGQVCSTTLSSGDVKVKTVVLAKWLEPDLSRLKDSEVAQLGNDLEGQWQRHWDRMVREIEIAAGQFTAFVRGDEARQLLDLAESHRSNTAGVTWRELFPLVDGVFLHLWHERAKGHRTMTAQGLFAARLVQSLVTPPGDSRKTQVQTKWPQWLSRADKRACAQFLVGNCSKDQCGYVHECRAGACTENHELAACQEPDAKGKLAELKRAIHK
jgi:hypothetical protein